MPGCVRKTMRPYNTMHSFSYLSGCVVKALASKRDPESCLQRGLILISWLPVAKAFPTHHSKCFPPLVSGSLRLVESAIYVQKSEMQRNLQENSSAQNAAPHTVVVVQVQMNSSVKTEVVSNFKSDPRCQTVPEDECVCISNFHKVSI